MARYDTNPRSTARAPRQAQQGVSLIELMIALTLGVLVLLSLTALYIKSSDIRNDNERTSRQVESGRYALQIITQDLQMAGYYAEFNPGPTGAAITVPASKPDPCATAVASLAAAIPLHVQGYDNGASAPTCLSDVKTGTDILVIRRSSGCTPGSGDCDALVTGDYLFQASSCINSSELGAATPVYYQLGQNGASGVTFSLHQRNCSTVAATRRYLVRIYFIANNNKSGDGVPTLKRAELGPTGFTISPLVDGIENLQIEYGLDTAGNGSPAAYTASPDGYSGCTNTTTPTCMQYWQSVVTAKIHLLARNTTTKAGFVDSKTYSLGLTAAGAANTVGPFSDAYQRHAYQSTVRLYNPGGRNATQ